PDRQAAGQYLSRTFTKVIRLSNSSIDGTTKPVRITVVRQTHPAVIGDPTVHDVTEDTAVNNAGNLTAAGTISISDPDQNQAAFQTTVIAANGNLGSLVLQADGHYTYTVADSAVQYLGGADSKIDSFTVSSVDGTTKQVSFTVHGVDDAPVAVADSYATNEDTALS